MLEVNWLVFDGFRMFARRDQLNYLSQLSSIETRYYIDRQNTRIQYYAIHQQNTVYSRKDTEVMIRSRLSSLLNRQSAFLTQYNLLEESLRAAENSLAIAQEQLQQGAISGFEFRQTQISSITLKNQLIELLFPIKTTEIDIDQLTGGLTQKLL